MTGSRMTARGVVLASALFAALVPEYAGAQTQQQPTGVICGISAPTSGTICNGTLCGYPAAKQICANVCNAQTAHMCTASEAVLNAQNLTVSAVEGQNAWMSAGLVFSRNVPFNLFVDDCGTGLGTGWTSSSPNDNGPVFHGGSSDGSIDSAVGTAPCNTSFPILCCH